MADSNPGEATLFARIPAQLHRDLFCIAERANLSVATVVAAMLAQYSGRTHPHRMTVSLAAKDYRNAPDAERTDR